MTECKNGMTECKNGMTECRDGMTECRDGMTECQRYYFNGIWINQFGLQLVILETLSLARERW